MSVERRSRSQGFTLIEVLLVVVIVGGGMAALLTAASRCVVAMKQGVVYEQMRRAMGEGDVIAYRNLPPGSAAPKDCGLFAIVTQVARQRQSGPGRQVTAIDFVWEKKDEIEKAEDMNETLDEYEYKRTIQQDDLCPEPE